MMTSLHNSVMKPTNHSWRKLSCSVVNGVQDSVQDPIYTVFILEEDHFLVDYFSIFCRCCLAHPKMTLFFFFSKSKLFEGEQLFDPLMAF